MRKAIDAVERNDVDARYQANRRAQDIVCYLRDTLDIEKGGEIASNSDRIYEFCIQRLLDIDLNNDATPAKEVIDILEPMEAAWRELVESGAGALGPAIETSSESPDSAETIEGPNKPRLGRFGINFDHLVNKPIGQIGIVQIPATNVRDYLIDANIF